MLTNLSCYMFIEFNLNNFIVSIETMFYYSQDSFVSFKLDSLFCSFLHYNPLRKNKF